MDDNGHPIKNGQETQTDINELRSQLKETSLQLKEANRQLKESNSIIAAIRDGEVDALLVSENKKDQVYILQGADFVYREIVEDMQEGYVTLSKDGVILFCNSNFAKVIHGRLDDVIGSSIYDLLPQSETEILLRSLSSQESFKWEFILAGKDFSVPVLASVNFRVDKDQFAYMIITDLTEQKRNEQRFMHRVFDQAGESIIVCDMTGKIIRVNGVATKVFGPGLLQKMFDTTVQLCRERDGKPFSVQGALHRGKTTGIEARYTCRDGRILSFLVSAGWLTESDPGNHIGYLVTLADITQRKLAEQDLAESEVRFRTLVENAKDIIYSMTPEGIFTYVSPNWKASLGHEVGELLGHSFAEFMHPDDHAAFYAFLERLVATGAAGVEKGIEHRAWHKNGELRWYISNASAVFDATGKVGSYSGIDHDITERKRAEEEMRSSQARYHTLMEQSFEAWALVDCQTREVVEINRRFTELLGYVLPEDAPLYNFQCVVDSQQNFDRYYNETLNRQRFLPTEARIYRHKNGTHVNVERGGSVVSIGGRDFLLVSLRDMTAERARQADLARDVEVAQRVQQALLPHLSDSPLVAIRTLNYPSHFISGDSYHLDWLNDGTLLRGFLVDISGHGLATALQTASVNVLLREAMTATASLFDQMRWINMRAAEYFTEGSYAAMLGFELDFSANELRYVGAGITMFYANGKKIETPGMFVGVWDDPKFVTGTLPFEPGDTFHFLTDGFTDALSQPGNPGSLLLVGNDLESDVAALEKLAQSEKLCDDATGVCLKIKECVSTQRVGEIIKTSEKETGFLGSAKLINELRVHQIELEMQNEELRCTQEELELSHAHYFDFYNTATVGYLTINEKELIVEANLKMASMLGIVRASLVGQTLAHFILPEDQDIYYLFLRQLDAENTPKACELRLKKKDSDPFWVRIDATLVRGAGDSYSFRAVISDITERKRTEETLVESESRYRAVIEQATEAVLICDPDTGEILEANARFTEHFGYDLNQDAPLNLFELVIDESEKCRDLWNRWAQTGSVPVQRRMFRHRNGSLISVERSATWVSYRDRRLFVVTLLDVSDEVRREQEILRDAQTATRVQNTLLSVPGPTEYLKIDTVYQPCGYVGGDLYFLDVRYDDSLLRGFLVDATGHGLGTALHTASMHVLLRDVNDRDLPLSDAMRWLNRRAGEYFDEGTFAGAIGFELDLSTRQLRTVCAGIPKFWVATGPKIGVELSPGMSLGINDDETFDMKSIPVDIGDSLYFMTDGLSGLLGHDQDLPLNRYPEMVALLRRLSESNERRDDATAVCIHILSLPQSLIRQDGWPRVIRFNGFGDYDRLKGEVSKIVEEVTGKPHSIHEVSVTEALANAMECRDGVPRQHKATLRFNKVGNRLIVRVKTSRIGFAGNAILKRLRLHPEEMFIVGEDAAMGRGIPMMLSLAQWMTYNEDGTEVLMAWKLPANLLGDDIK